MKSRGTYLLEFSFAVLGTAFLVIAVLDLASILRARSAVRVAVESGLRCMFPTDSGCPADAAIVESASGPRFDVFVRPNFLSYGIPTYRLRTSVEWYSLPRRAEEVISGSYETTRQRALIVRERFPVEATGAYLSQVTGLPDVGGTSINPTFSLPSGVREDNGVYTISLSANGSTSTNCSGNDYDSACEIGVVPVGPLPIIQGDQSIFARQVQPVCYLGDDTRNGCERFDSKTAGSDLFESAAAAGFSATQGLMHISGSTQALESGAEGKVTFQIEYPDNSYLPEGNIRRLGGRVVSDGGNDHFVIRGLGAKRFAGDSSDYKEIELHNALTIPVNASFRVRFFLQSSNGKRIGWKGAQIRIFTPTYRVTKLESVNCSQLTDSIADHELIKACVSHPFAKTFFEYRARTDRPQIEPMRDAGCFEKLPELSEVLSSEELRNGYRLKVVEAVGGSVCANRRKDFECPPGASLEKVVCNNAFPADDRASVCPAPSNATNITYRTVSKSPSKSSEICFLGNGLESLNCESKTFNRPAVETDRISPVGICSLALLHTLPMRATSDMPERSCGSSDASESEILKAAVVPVPPQGVPISVIREERGELFSATKPVDPCIRFSTYEKGASRELVCGRQLTKSQAEQCCDKAGGVCRVEEVRRSETERNIHFNALSTDRAVIAANEALDAVWPGGSLECKEASASACSEVAFETSSAGIASGKGRMTVPLRILKFLPGADEVTLTFDGSRVTEEAVALKSIE